MNKNAFKLGGKPAVCTPRQPPSRDQPTFKGAGEEVGKPEATDWAEGLPPESGGEPGAPHSQSEGSKYRHSRPDRFLVRNGDRWIFVKTSAIQWIEAENNYVRLHVEGESYRVRHTMSGILARLNPKQFKRIHRSAIVNLDFIQELQSWTGGDMVVFMRDGTHLTLSRAFRHQFSEWR